MNAATGEDLGIPPQGDPAAEGKGPGSGDGPLKLYDGKDLEKPLDKEDLNALSGRRKVPLS